MNKKRIVVSALLAACVGGIYAQSEYWPTPNPEARPGARWWWLGSAVDSLNLAYNIEQYAAAGMGALEITPIYGVQGNEANELSFLSPRWMRMLDYTQTVGQQQGVQIDMNNGTGWPFGGPLVTEEDAATKLLVMEFSYKQGETLDVQYRNPSKPREKGVLSRLMAYRIQSNGEVIPVAQRKAGDCVNLTSLVVDNQLTWDGAKEEWKLIALYVGKTGQQVKRAAPGGEGLVIDHFSAGAVDRYLKNFTEAFERENSAFPNTFFSDSYEVYGADWTPLFLEEFAKRRGYKLELVLPEFLAETKNDLSKRILSDYRETISDLLLEHFTTRWGNWAHQHGSKTRNQAHGSPANLIDQYAAVDIPECEGFGLSEFHIDGLRADSLTRRNDSDMSMLKYASSAAHIAGKPFTSSETFTWLTEHFRTSLSQCKPDIDLMFVAGVNRAFFHGATYSPREAKWPGWRFYASVDMTPTNSIWRDAPAFFSYITRCQSFLQMGKPDNDFLVYLPVYDMWYEQPGRLLQFDIHSMEKRAPQFIETIHEIISHGYDVDYISDRYIQSTKVVDGELQTVGKTNYKAIIIPNATTMPASTIAHLLQLAKQGATIVFQGKLPNAVPGYLNSKAEQNVFGGLAKLFAKVDEKKNCKVVKYGKGLLTLGEEMAANLSQCKTRPESMRTDFGLSTIRRSNSQGHHYFIASLQANAVEGWVTLGVEAQEAHFFDPLTGKVGRAQLRNRNGETQVYLQLKSGESILLQTFVKPTHQHLSVWNYLVENVATLVLDQPWQLSFVACEPMVKGSFSIESPRSWTALEGIDEATQQLLATTMATGCYTTTFTLPATAADDWVLDLGDVRESARVRLNGHEVGVAWSVPFRLRIGEYLRAGENRLEIEVTNLPANRIAQMDRAGEPWRIFKEINVVDLKYRKTTYGHWPVMPSGLNSEVKLIPCNYLKNI